MAAPSHASLRWNRLRTALARDPYHVFALTPELGPARTDGLDLGGAPVLDPAAALDEVVADDRALAIDAVVRAMEVGESEQALHMVDGSLAVVRLFDLCADAGCIVGVVVPALDADAAPEDARTALAPRIGRVTFTQQGQILGVDESYCRMFGFRDAAEVVGLPGSHWIHLDDRSRALAAWVAALARPQQEQRVRYRRLRADGTSLWCEALLTNHLDEPDPRVEAELLDISAEMAAHAEVEARERLLQRLAESLPDGVLQLAADHRVVYANRRAGELLGDPSVEGLVQRTVERDRGPLRDAIAASLADGGDRVVEVEVHPPGDPEPSDRRQVTAVYEVTMRAVTDPGHGAITGALCCVSDVTRQARDRRELEARATLDAVTACANRRATIEALAGHLTAVEPGTGVAVAFLDLDRFKDVNDRFGHGAGDQYLRAVADRVRTVVRPGDTLGRIGGDEFLVVCPGTAGPDVGAVAERIAGALRAPVSLDGQEIVPHASLGTAWTDDPTTSAEALVGEADAAMYRAKRTRAR